MAAPQLPFDDWMVLQQVSGTRPFQAMDDSRESCCGRQRYEQVHVIGHDIGGDHLSIQRVQYLAEELFCHDRYLVDENRATLLCRPHKVIGEGGDGRSCVSLLNQTTAHARSISSCLLGDRRLDAGSISIFIDAGYLFKQGAGAVFNAKLGRHQLLLDAQHFMTDLCRWVCERYSADELLRTYWYDGARHGIPTLDQLEVAALPFVKLRVGRINSAGQQKGVDTLMVRDLMVLSQERSIHRAVVLSGDEDLREGIEYAQDRGVRVAVLGIDVNGERNQSVELVREADESLLLPQELLVASMQKRESATHSTSKSEAPAIAATEPNPAPGPSAPDAAGEFARDWVAKATADELAAILENRPRLPRSIDALMLQHAVAKLGVPTIDEDTRRGMRTAFWRELDAKTST